jgi:hypothetical protein
MNRKLSGKLTYLQVRGETHGAGRETACGESAREQKCGSWFALDPILRRRGGDTCVD